MMYTVTFDEDLVIVLDNIEDVHQLVDFMFKVVRKFNVNLQCNIKGENKK